MVGTGVVTMYIHVLAQKHLGCTTGTGFPAVLLVR